MWFSPVRERPLDHSALLRKVINITEVVASSSKDMGLEWFEMLLSSVSILECCIFYCKSISHSKAHIALLDYVLCPRLRSRSIFHNNVFFLIPCL